MKTVENVDFGRKIVLVVSCPLLNVLDSSVKNITFRILKYAAGTLKMNLIGYFLKQNKNLTYSLCSIDTVCFILLGQYAKLSNYIWLNILCPKLMSKTFDFEIRD